MASLAPRFKRKVDRLWKQGKRPIQIALACHCSLHKVEVALIRLYATPVQQDAKWLTPAA